MAAADADSPGVASAVVSSAPPQTPYADVRPGVEEVPPPNVGIDGPTPEETDPSWAERLSGLRSDEAKKTGGKKTGAPSENELAEFLGEKLLRWLMIFYVSWLTSPLEWAAEDQRKLIAPAKDRKLMVQPLARLAAQTQLNERIGRKVLDADDVIDALVMFGLWVDTTRPLLRERMAVKAEQRAHTPMSTPITTEAPHEPGRAGPPGGGNERPDYGGGVTWLPGAFPPGGSGA